MPRQAALEIDRVGFADGAVGGQLDGRALHERARRHHDLRVVARHGPRDGGHIAVDRGRRLNAAAEGQHPLRRAELDGLNDIVPRFRPVRHDAEAQPLIHIRGKNRALERPGNDVRGKEEALVQTGQQAEIRADLLSEAGGRETVGAALDAFRRAADIAADGGQSAAGVFDQAADDHVRAHVRRLDPLDKFAVAVVDHAQNVRPALLAECDQLPDLRDGERRPCRVALRALDGDELCFGADRGADAVKIERAVRQQVDLPVLHAVFHQRTPGRTDADDLLQRVIRRAVRA